MISLREIAKMGRAIRPIAAIIRFFGGYDTETPPLSLPSGYVRSAQNFECNVNGGYSTAEGYEKFDGRPEPSAAVYYVINITLTGAVATGDTVTGVNSAATGVVIVSQSTLIAITKVVGTFQSGEVLNVGGNPQATTISVARLNGASTVSLKAQYKNLAADNYRADIAVPTGAGSVLGVKRFGNVTYQWRNNSGNTAANIWKSSSTGWQQVTLFNEVSFTLGGATQPAEGATLTQGANTALIKRVVLTSGTWAGNDAAGRLIVSTPAPGNFAAGAATVGAINLTLSAAQTAITLQPSGRYEMVVANFAGTLATKRIYGCDGVNRGFEFDGTVLVPITTGMTTDTPTHVVEHKKHLFFSFANSIQHSGPGTPYIWTPVVGSTEIATGDTVTGFAVQPGSETTGALAIFTRNQINILYGTSVSNWVFIPYRQELGGYAYTLQDVGYTIYLDDQGITNIATAQEFGNFTNTMLSSRIKTWLAEKRPKSVASCVVRDKSQYRIFFNDKYALYVTFVGKKIMGFMPIYMSDAVTCIDSSEDSDGTEVIFFGSTDGNVYQMDKGTSFDGDNINAFLNLSWDFLKSPRLLKRFFDCALEVSGLGYAEYQFGYKLGYGSSLISQKSTNESVVTSFANAQYDAGYQWDAGNVWDGQTLTPSLVGMGGEGENVSIGIRSNSDYFEPITFSGAVISYVPRRQIR